MDIIKFITNLYKKTNGETLQLLLNTRADLVYLSGSKETVEQKINELKNVSNILETSIANINNSVQNADTKIDKVNNKLNTHEINQNAHPQAFENVTGNLLQYNNGKINALSQNLNNEEIIEVSGEWTAPLSTHYIVTCIAGGWGSYFENNTKAGLSGKSGNRITKIIYLEKDQNVPVIIGAEGVGCFDNYNINLIAGGKTSFGNISTDDITNPYLEVWPQIGIRLGSSGNFRISVGPNSKLADWNNSNNNGYNFGGGAGISYLLNHTMSNPTIIGNGYPGCIIIRWNDPYKTNASYKLRKANNVVSSKVKLVSQLGNVEVWENNFIDEKIVNGYKTFDVWETEQNIISEQKRQEWITNPNTVEERFGMLELACESKLAQTDYAMNLDYPISDESKIALMAYRKAIRDINHQSGAPWDGGGELTPWPEMPIITKAPTNK